MTYTIPDFQAMERKKPVISIINSMLYCENYFTVNLKTLSQASLDSKSFFFYYDKGGSSSVDISAFLPEEVNELKSLVLNYIKNVQTLRIFKNLQSSNPIASPTELWEQAEQTFSLLDKKGLAAEY